MGVFCFVIMLSDLDLGHSKVFFLCLASADGLVLRYGK
jgi:hypothetical protein